MTPARRLTRLLDSCARLKLLSPSELAYSDLAQQVAYDAPLVVRRLLAECEERDQVIAGLRAERATELRPAA